MTELPIEIIRSDRRTVYLEFARDGHLILRIPKRMPRSEIDRIMHENRSWIEEHRSRVLEHLEKYPEPTEEERRELIRKAREILPSKVARYAEIMGVRPAGITITGAEKRFGSCSAKNRLSFSWRLMRYPEEAIDYVVVHELAHIRHHDHSAAFYAFIERFMPDHKERRALLKR